MVRPLWLPSTLAATVATNTWQHCLEHPALPHSGLVVSPGGKQDITPIAHVLHLDRRLPVAYSDIVHAVPACMLQFQQVLGDRCDNLREGHAAQMQLDAHVEIAPRQAHLIER